MIFQILIFALTLASLTLASKMLSNFIFKAIKFIVHDIWRILYFAILMIYFSYKHYIQYKKDLKYEKKYGHLIRKPPREEIGCVTMCKDISPSDLFIRLNMEYDTVLRNESMYDIVRAAVIVVTFQYGMYKCNREDIIDMQLTLINHSYSLKLICNYNPILCALIKTTYKDMEKNFEKNIKNNVN